MIGAIERRIMGWLRIPPEPTPPFGSPESTRTFLASRRYYRYRLTQWIVTKQVPAVVGILFFLWLTSHFHVVWEVADRFVIELQRDRFMTFSIRDLIVAAEVIGIVAFVVQIPLGYVMIRLDYRMRWYMLTDRSLRIRAGLWRITEQTLTFANIQNVTLRQGPVERLLGIASVKVRTAGGGSGADASDGDDDSAGQKALHIGWLRGLDDAANVRDQILAALHRYRDSGLGDPDEAVLLAESSEAPSTLAARELLDELRAWRLSLGA